MAITRTADGRKRSVAWLFYALVTLALVATGFTAPASFVAALATGAYSTYLFRGGRFVLWIF